MSAPLRHHALFMARGFAVVPWAHHPPEVKAAIRASGRRPMVKQCYANCQAFLLGLPAAMRGRFQYREGRCRWREATFTHAWLLFDGAVLDLTLPSEEITYLESRTADCEEIAHAGMQRRRWGPLFPDSGVQ